MILLRGYNMKVTNLKDVKIGIWYLYCNIQNHSFIKISDTGISQLSTGASSSLGSPNRNVGPVCPLKI
jgi:hypothetical protein